MRPSMRFLGLAVAGWVGVRCAMLGQMPGAGLFRIERSEAKTPALVGTHFPTIPPVEPPAPGPSGDYGTEAYVPGPESVALAAVGSAIRYLQAMSARPVPVQPPVGRGYPMSRAMAEEPILPLRATRLGAVPASEPVFYSQLPPLDRYPLTRLASMAGPVSPPAIPEQSDPVLNARKIDRLQLAAWALVRSQQTGIAGSRSLATHGQLGASQAGARLIYNYNRRIAVAARMSSEVGRRGGEVAAGLRVRPLASLPLWVTAERRQAIGRYGGGRSAFALFLEGGIYGHPLPWRFTFDTYLQSGVVGAKSRDWFVDGAFAATRPVYRNFSAGFGVWGAAQPGLSRLDAGPRVSMRVRNNLKVHLDWRQKLVGNATPGSGPALTLSGDF